MKRVIYLIIFLILGIIFFPKKILAQDFNTSVSIGHRLTTTHEVESTYHFRIQNLTTEKFSEGLTFHLFNSYPTEIHAFENGIAVPFEITNKDDSIEINLKFQNVVVGRGSIRRVDVVTKDTSLFEKLGSVSELVLPRLTQGDIEIEKINVVVPNDLGKVSFVSPKVTQEKAFDDRKEFIFEDTSLFREHISITFGDFEAYDVDITYKLLERSDTTEIKVPIPPDTAFQKVIIKAITPRPERIALDIDGNWIADFGKNNNLANIQVKALIQLFPTPRKFLESSADALKASLSDDEFWQTKDPVILGIPNLKSPKEIFDYVVEKLSYNYQAIGSANVVRKGAVYSLKNTTDALCMEFTDLFITLARANGIPAREINGYAYVTDPIKNPLSLIKDVLHAWPEYWDKAEKRWVPVDPTWADTTGGGDFFTKLDMRHLTFVIHGSSSRVPLLPGVNDNEDISDFTVSLSKLPHVSKRGIDISEKVINEISGKVNISVTIKNTGESAIYEKKLIFTNDSTGSEEIVIAQLPPFGEYVHTFSIPGSVFAKGMPTNAHIKFDNLNRTVDINVVPIILTHFALILLPVIIGVSLLIVTLRKLS